MRLSWATLVLSALTLFATGANAQRRRAHTGRETRGSGTATGSLTVTTGHEGSVVFINNIRHGVTDSSGRLVLAAVRVGLYPVKIRTVGYNDWGGSVVITEGRPHELKLNQQATADQAVLHYQKGDQLRDQAKNDEAVAEYKQAVAMNAGLPEARIGMARSLITLQDFETAETQLQAVLRAGRGPVAEAQTVLANLRRSQGLTDESMIAYRKAIRLAGGVSPEAHVGLAIALEEKGDLDSAVKEYRIGISQDMDTEPILYYLLGNALEKAQKNDLAIDAYANYLRLDPQGQYSSAVASIIKRLKEDQPQ